ncbi:MAG: hypothetical protein RDU89_09375 [bacterium]|nr:hypothetical protein [bacterium]
MKARVYLLVLVGTAAVAATADWLGAILIPGSPRWAHGVAFFLLVKLTGDLIRGLAEPRAQLTAFWAERLAEMAFFAGLGLVAAWAADVAGAVLGARANLAAVAVLAHLGVLFLGGEKR